MKKRKRKPARKIGTCCYCGYAGSKETPCDGVETDGAHCVHWWEGAEAPKPKRRAKR